MTEATLAERYGTRRTPRGPRFWWIVAIVGVVTGTIAVAVVVLSQPAAHIEYSAPRYVTNSDGNVDVSVTVTMAPGATARCAVQVLGDGQSTVGWRYVNVPASSEYTQTIVATVRSIDKAIAAAVPTCWLTTP